MHFKGFTANLGPYSLAGVGVIDIIYPSSLEGGIGLSG